MLDVGPGGAPDVDLEHAHLRERRQAGRLGDGEVRVGPFGLDDADPFERPLEVGAGVLVEEAGPAAPPVWRAASAGPSTPSGQRTIEIGRPTTYGSMR